MSAAARARDAAGGGGGGGAAVVDVAAMSALRPRLNRGVGDDCLHWERPQYAPLGMMKYWVVFVLHYIMALRGVSAV